MKTIFKYIIVNSGAIVFPETVTHAQVAQGFDVVYAAGFATLDLIKLTVVCWGESASLRIKSQPETDCEFVSDVFSPMPYTKYFGLMAAGRYKEIKRL